MPLTKEEQQRSSFLIAKAAAREVSEDMWLRLGVDLNDSDSVQAFTDDLRWARSYRRKCEAIGSSILAGATTILTGGILYLLWDALKLKFKG